MFFDIFHCKGSIGLIEKIDGRSLRVERLDIRKVERPSKEELENMLKDTSYVAVGKKYGVSDNSVRKWAKSYCII